MKSVYVKDFSKYLEKEISEVFYLKNVSYSYTDGKKWQDLVLLDISGRMIGKCWSEYIKKEYFTFSGMIVRVTGRVELFRDIYGMRVVEMHPVLENEYDPKDFRVSLTDEETDQLVSRLKELMDDVCDKQYKALLNAIFTPGKIKKFLELPAEYRDHHSYDGGWLKHAIEVTELSLAAVEICSGGPMAEVGINKDLMITGSLLYNVGQLSALRSAVVNPILTARGKLVGHIHDGAIFISCTNNAIDDRVEDLTQLIHIVVSAHHDSNERPMTKEAIIVAQSAALSAAYNAVDTTFSDYDKWHPEESGRVNVKSNYFEAELIRPGKGAAGYV